MMDLKDKLYTSTEVAQILGVSLRSVYRYLEDGKLIAEVKTATGRHRFTRKNILDFLYPDGQYGVQDTPVDASDDAKEETNAVPQPAPAPKPAEQPAEVEVAKEPIVDKEVEPAPATTPTPTLEVKEEEVDWLTKFREAAKKFEADGTEDKIETPKNEETVSGLSSLAAQETPAPSPTPSEEKVFYRSGIGGLREIAQNLDKTAKNSSIDYEFTLSAGLSLFKPIKPFSVLHAYVRPDSKELFETMLKLQPASESDAQLCLIITDKQDVYLNKQEMHGLSVVSKEKLAADVAELGSETLKEEAKSVLS